MHPWTCPPGQVRPGQASSLAPFGNKVLRHRTSSEMLLDVTSCPRRTHDQLSLNDTHIRLYRGSQAGFQQINGNELSMLVLEVLLLMDLLGVIRCEGLSSASKQAVRFNGFTK